MRCFAKGTTLVRSGAFTQYCCKENQSCQQSTWAPLWNGRTIIEGKEADVAKFADKIVTLRKLYGTTHFWTASPYGGTTSQHSCSVHTVMTTYGSVGSGQANRNYTTVNVLCE